ncbi:hypothetical protein [Microbacterium sp. WCS2018Hpa-9]|uniref:hypothetical protein n=1 Tax=Microbacterium sp. WCS2018Hpa-9 TaxID=3073635 RepID=UPI00288A5B89|nr:hypothetical protein [Microbacterium sp. WCS2018Hpa-9]
MTGAAQYLHDFFVAQKGQNGRAFRPLYLATCELEDQLHALATVGGRVQAFLDLVPRIREVLNQYCDQELGMMSAVGGPGIRLDDRDLSLLDLAIERTELDSPMSADREQTLRGLLDAVRDLVSEDETLDPQLRLFIVRAAAGVKIAVDDYEITGDFILRDALLRLFGLLRAAEETSESPTRWKDAWQKYGVPATAGLIASVPQIALTSAQIIQALPAS